MTLPESGAPSEPGRTSTGVHDELGATKVTPDQPSQGRLDESGSSMQRKTLLPILLFLIMCVALIWGFTLRPRSVSPPPLRTSFPGGYIHIGSTSAASRSWSLYVYVGEANNGGSSLRVTDGPAITARKYAGPSGFSYTTTIDISKLSPGSSLCRVPPKSTVLHTAARDLRVFERSTLDFTICFAPGEGPIQRNSPDLSVYIPTFVLYIDKGPNNSIPPPLESTVELGTHDLDNTAVLTGSVPSTISENAWDWTRTIDFSPSSSSTATAYVPEVVVPVASNLLKVQTEDRESFASGILLGIGGAALIGFLQETRTSLRDRKLKST